jgi:hypothetical protein
MSKMDNLRAMREARYEAATARAGKPTTQSTSKPTTKQAKPATTKAATKAPNASATPADSPSDDTQPETALCGHRAISGRTCTREAGHAAKSHRYA